jgi:hypothetical protein
VGLTQFILNITFYWKWVRTYNAVLRIHSFHSFFTKERSEKGFESGRVYSDKVAQQKLVYFVRFFIYH